MSDLVFLPSDARPAWGVLCVCDSYYTYDVPQRITQYWPLHEGERYQGDVLAYYPEIKSAGVLV